MCEFKPENDKPYVDEDRDDENGPIHGWGCETALDLYIRCECSKEVIPIGKHDLDRAFRLEPPRRSLHRKGSIEGDFTVFDDALGGIRVLSVKNDRRVIASRLAQRLCADEVVAPDEYGTSPNEWPLYDHVHEAVDISLRDQRTVAKGGVRIVIVIWSSDSDDVGLGEMRHAA